MTVLSTAELLNGGGTEYIITASFLFLLVYAWYPGERIRDRSDLIRILIIYNLMLHWTATEE